MRLAAARSGMMRPSPCRVARAIHSPSFNLKYADKLRKKAQEKGLDLKDLQSQAQQQARCQQRKEAASLKNAFPSTKTRSDTLSSPRRDSSPVKPLSSILNLAKLLATPHTPPQISALWTAYHASRANGTGRGYICASLSLDSYNAMMRVAKKYPVFVLPVPRDASDPPPHGDAGPAHEFFFLQWDFHPPPPVPSAVDPDPFKPVSSSHLPEQSTVLFTPLQEYKLRTSYATPYLVLTFYTDLSQSHGIVLLRGEITPSPTSTAVQSTEETRQRFLLNQVDAQLLAMGLQKFYLWGEGDKDGAAGVTEALLKQFHEEPEKFSWQDLLKSSHVIA